MAQTTGAERKASLKIHPTPFKSSHLSTPPSPFSPLSPLNPQHQQQTTKPKTSKPARPTTSRTSSTTSTTSTISTVSTFSHASGNTTPDSELEQPPSPLQWLWQCHECHRTYGLGVTRRCLEDGHVFCAGTTTLKNWRKALNPRKQRIKRHRACGSEFDYQGWKTWGRWRRGSAALHDAYDSDGWSTASSNSTSPSSRSSSDGEASSGSTTEVPTPRQSVPDLVPTPKKDCWNGCDYPSECRWGRQYGVHTPLTAVFPTLPTESPKQVVQSADLSRFEEGFLGRKTESGCGKKEKTDFWSALVASASRRMSVPPSSPLAGVAEEGEVQCGLMRDEDGDVVMDEQGGKLVEQSGTVNPQHLTLTESLTAAATSPVVTLKDLISKKSKNRMSKRSKRMSAKSTTSDESGEEELKGLAPLKRYTTSGSSDSGYHSVGL